MKRTVAIIGGGLAGIAAALRLADSDHTPILIETSRRLGGRATSFDDSRSGAMLDNCQHVVMGCCTNVLDLYERLDVLDFIEWSNTVYWTSGRGEIDELKSGWLPAPLHMSGALRRMKLLTKEDKRHIARAMWRIIRMGSKGRMAWRDSTFRAFLDETGQPESAVNRFWNVIVVSSCNLDVEQCGAAFALQVFQEGFLNNRFSCAIGLPTIPLRNLYDPALELIEQCGGRIHFGCSAIALAYDGNRIKGVNTSEGLIDASSVISAVPFDRLDKLISDTLRRADTRLQNLSAFKHSPILGVHLFFDRTILKHPHLTVVDHDVQWVFNKGVDESGHQHLHVVISGAEAWMDLDQAEITQRIVKDIHDVLPNSVGLEPLGVRVIKEKRATFAPTPEIYGARPGAAPSTVGLRGGGVPNLYLAGDWTDVGWPSTMEGAVRSGYAATEAITGQECVVDDIPTSMLGRVLGLS